MPRRQGSNDQSGPPAHAAHASSTSLSGRARPPVGEGGLSPRRGPPGLAHGPGGLVHAGRNLWPTIACPGQTASAAWETAVLPALAPGPRPT